MKAGIFDLHATSNVIELPVVETFTRSPESRRVFLEKCDIAAGRLQVAQISFGRWLSGIAIAYGEAFEAHNSFIGKISNEVRIGNEMLLGFALAFVGGATGNLVASAMKNLTGSDPVIEGVKDFAKFATRNPVIEATRGGSISPMPATPTLWQNRINERVLAEMTIAAKALDIWRTSVTANDDTFDAGFDPVTTMDKALVISNGSGRTCRLAELPEVDKEKLKSDYEKGWLAAWIPMMPRPLNPISINDQRELVIQYGRKVGLETTRKLLDQRLPEFAPGPEVYSY